MSETYQVLLIEDNPGDARLLQEMLAEAPPAPFRLTCADRLSRAMEVLSSQKIELLLLDLSLPDSHGLETFAKVYAHSPKVPIIVLTGNDSPANRARSLAGGAGAYLCKPVDDDVLLRTIRRLIDESPP